MLNKESSEAVLGITLLTSGRRELNMGLELLEQTVMVKGTAGTSL